MGGGGHNQNLLVFTAADVVPCGSRKTSPRISSKCRYNFGPLGSLSSFLVF